MVCLVQAKAGWPGLKAVGAHFVLQVRASAESSYMGK